MKNNFTEIKNLVKILSLKSNGLTLEVDYFKLNHIIKLRKLVLNRKELK